MLSEGERSILNQFADAVERKKRRDWSPEAGQKIDLDTAIEQTTQILREQWGPSPRAEEPGYQFYVGLAMVERYFTVLPPIESEIGEAISLAKDDLNAFQALRFLVASGIGSASPELALWSKRVMAGTLREPRAARGPSQVTNLWRDHLFCGQIERLKDAGFTVFRNAATEDESSACDIVAKASHLLGDGRGVRYETVEGIWKRSSRLLRPEMVARAILQPFIDALSPTRPSEK